MQKLYNRARMDRTGLRGSSSLVDLESGEYFIERNEIKDQDSVRKKGKAKLGKLRSGSLNFTGLKNSEESSSSDEGLSSCDNLEKLVDEGREVKEKRKKQSSKKPPKPPRPPGGPSLDAADMKMVRELSELAKLKHARIERMRALKNKRVEKASYSSSSKTNVLAMIITILFLFVVIFQGLLGSRV